MVPEAVTNALDANLDAHVEGLCEFLRMPSIANDPARPDPCRRCAEWLGDQMKQMGLSAEVVDAPGKPVVLGSAPAGEADAPTLLIYAHYDVQPPDPLDAWRTDPFEPVLRDGAIYARGASDDKGPLWAALLAVAAWRDAGPLPVNVTFLLEGEEEIGSPNIDAVVDAHAERLSADAAVIPDTQFFTADLPSITYGLRGLAYFELELRGPSEDVHSGLHGGAAANPADALARLVAALHDETGTVTLDGFYDAVRPVTDAERAAWRELPFDEAAYAASLGVSALGGGEAGRGVLERLWARPTLDANGLVAGYTGEGAKTIIPSRATAKVSCRLVPDQDPQQVVAAFRDFVAARTPEGLTADVRVHATARPFLVPLDEPVLRAGREALQEAFGCPPAMIRCGASIPVAECIQRTLDLPTALLGCTLPDDNPHAPNEKYALAMLRGTAAAIAALMGNLAR
ncbi:MAG: dipeptidase [Phycisphaerae bacterium]|nr:dipeptidase [Phycisphaerae bacterium]